MDDKKKYADTLNLPKTNFPMKARLSQREPEILKFWKKIDLYHKMQELRDKGEYILHDGPPYANGHIHIGHALNKILKDIIIRQKNMLGYKTPYIPGWDCHGLPIEHKVEEQLGEKKQTMTTLQIRKECENYARNYVSIQKAEFKRLGIMADWDRPYLTYNKMYETKIIEIFAKLFADGYIVKRQKPVYWCPSCKTALAEAEVEYADHKTPAIYVKFEYKSGKDKLFADAGKKYFIVIWTTTPWTLPANVAVAVHPELTYSFLDFGNEVFIVAKELIPDFVEKNNLGSYTELRTAAGAELEGILLRHPFIARDSVVINADYVSLDAGTGCVHIAPGHGEEDYAAGLKYNLPLLSPVNDDGVFTKEAGKYSGKFVFDANTEIIEDLKHSGHLLSVSELTHSYPHCWRCKSPIIFRSTPQWFIEVDHDDLRKKVLSEIEKIKWVPAWGQNRITAMVENRPDWCISRQRQWGVPIPVFYCKDCGETIATEDTLNHFIELVRKEGTNAWFKYSEEELLPKDFACPHCGSKNLVKEKDILDVWFDSGASFNGVLNVYPELHFPSDLYLEGSDQHRGWFQSSIFLSNAKEGTSPFKSVLTHGFVVDKEGKKMSKSIGNAISPQDIIQKYGAEIIRLWVASSDYRDDIKISDEIISRTTDAYRKIRNTARFILGNIFDLSDFSLPEYQKLISIDKWILSRFEALKEGVTEAYEKFEFYSVYHQIYNFCAIELSSLYLDIVKDRLYVEGADSKTRRDAQRIIYHILHELTILIAPILAFTGEELWQSMKKLNSALEESVQLAMWPKFDKTLVSADVEKEWTYILSVREIVQKALEQKRQQNVIGHSLDAEVQLYLKRKIDLSIKELADIFVVSGVELLDEVPAAFDAGDGEAGIYAMVSKSKKEKCMRCWKYADLNKELGVCPRCEKVLTDMAH